MAARSGFSFGPFQLDPQRRTLRRDGELVTISVRSVELLSVLAARSGHIVSKDELVTAAWAEVAVTDNSLAQAIAQLRRTIGDAWVSTHPRRGYRFDGAITRIALPESDEVLDALLAPHRAWIEGRAALETMEGSRVQPAREAFELVLAADPGQAAAHVGLANACIFQFEMTRADATRDRGMLAKAIEHARHACRLDPEYGEAWGALGFALARAGSGAANPPAGNPDDARAALRRAMQLEPDNWHHVLRLSYGSWGEERLSAARRTLTLMPHLPMAHWLGATVHVARQAFPEAERELQSGLGNPHAGGVALHWLTGLLHLARDEDDAAMAAFTRELANEPRGLLYSRECCANTHYAIGALHLRRGRHAEAVPSFQEALVRLPAHPLARIGLARALFQLGRMDEAATLVSGLLEGDRAQGAAAEHEAGGESHVDVAIARAVGLCLRHRESDAAPLVADALEHAPAGPTGWLLPVEPILHVQAHHQLWKDALDRLRNRAT